MQEFDVMILGGGASGLMCAAWLSEHSSHRVGIIEGNREVGKKLKISGGGKCNITNVDVQSKHFLGDRDFIEEVFKGFGKEELLAYLHARGLNPVVRKERYYFCPKSADEIISIFKRATQRSHVFTGETILHVMRLQNAYEVVTERKRYRCRKLVVATGGESYKSIGASAIGLEIAQSMGHAVKTFQPALAGLTLQPPQFWMKELSGISMPVQIRVADRVINEEMLFAHKGISGPAVLSASLYWHKGEIAIDFLPGLHVEQLCRKSGKFISTALPLSKRFVKRFLGAVGVKDKPCKQLREDELQRLQTLHTYTMAPSGNFGFTKAEVSRGGVVTEEIDAKTMASRLHQGLYFIGEVLDVTGELGGYNFQWAFSSAVKCAKSL